MRQTVGGATDGSRNPFAMLISGRAYRAVFYFLLGIPLGLLYMFVFTGVVSSFAGGLIGLLAAIVVALAVGWLLTWLERGLASWLLDAKFTPVAAPAEPGASLWQRFLAHLRNPVTWKALVYLAARVPAALVGLLALAVLGVALALVSMPVLVIINALSTAPGVENTLDSLGAVPNLSADIVSLLNGVSGLALALVSPVLGVLLWLLGLWFFTSLGRGWAWFARQMLGVSPTALQLAETRLQLSEAHARSERVEDQRRRLILDASHELRTPVATVRAQLDSLLLLEDARLDDTLRRYLTIMQREMERLGLLVDDLLMLARADADKLRLDVRPVAIAALVEEVYQTMAPLAARDRQVTLVRQIAPDAPVAAYADRARLAQALMNLVRNAITHTPAGGLVSIALARGATPETLSLTVTDTGAGIADDDLPHVFERFYRADAARARDTGGFGLGLSIVRDLVEAMGGTVSAGRGPEGGAQFQITLRAASLPAASTSAAASAPYAEAATPVTFDDVTTPGGPGIVP